MHSSHDALDLDAVIPGAEGVGHVRSVRNPAASRNALGAFALTRARPFMDVTITRADRQLQVIAVRGDIDLATTGELLLRLQLLAPGREQVALDLSQVTFINRAGLHALIALSRQMRTTGAGLRLAAASLPVARLLELAARQGEPVYLLAPPSHDTAQGAATPDGRSEAWPGAVV